MVIGIEEAPERAAELAEDAAEEAALEAALDALEPILLKTVVAANVEVTLPPVAEAEASGC